MIAKIELIIIKLLIKVIRYFSINKRISSSKKKYFTQLCIDNGFNKNDFIWKSNVIKFKIYSVISFKKYGYYFVFENNNKEYDYFPSWPDEKVLKDDYLDQEFLSWINSIKRVLKRSNQINISISDGAELRKNFPNFASIIDDDKKL